MKTEKMIITALVIVAICISLLYREYNRPAGSSAETEPDFYISARSLAGAFHKNEKEANMKYLGKDIEVSGDILEVKHDNHSMVIVLKGNVSENINCTLRPELTITKETLTLGHSVVMRGICTGFLMDVIMTNCIITTQ